MTPWWLVSLTVGALFSTDLLLAQKSKDRDKTELDFEESDVLGERKTPMGALIQGGESSGEYSFIKLRKHWRDEVKRSSEQFSLDHGDSED